MDDVATEFESSKRAIAAALGDLDAKLGSLVEAIERAETLVNVQGVKSHTTAVKRVCEAYLALDFDEDDDESSTLPGVIGVPGAVIARDVSPGSQRGAAAGGVCAQWQGESDEEWGTGTVDRGRTLPRYDAHSSLPTVERCHRF